MCLKGGRRPSSHDHDFFSIIQQQIWSFSGDHATMKLPSFLLAFTLFASAIVFASPDPQDPAPTRTFKATKNTQIVRTRTDRRNPKTPLRPVTTACPTTPVDPDRCVDRPRYAGWQCACSNPVTISVSNFTLDQADKSL